MSEKEIKLKVIEQVDGIAKAISRGNDVEITKTSAGIVFKEISKKKIK